MEIKARIGELFNLADPNYVGLNTIEHAFKLARPPPKDLMKTAKYRKRCFDQIEGITATNKELASEVERLRRQLEAADQERTKREAQNQNLVGQLNNKELEKTSLEAEVTRLQGENSRVTAECGRLKEDNKKLARSQSELQDHTAKMKDDLKILKVNAKRHLELLEKRIDLLINYLETIRDALR
ncbi:uncharacterized protein [Miscanthus floridulus]|uniref:uncharacterized protein n=1 Tax=Miscanthus floridulus TaxID=154761 RepID=UPI003459BF7D